MTTPVPNSRSSRSRTDSPRPSRSPSLHPDRPVWEFTRWRFIRQPRVGKIQPESQRHVRCCVNQMTPTGNIVSAHAKICASATWDGLILVKLLREVGANHTSQSVRPANIGTVCKRDTSPKSGRRPAESSGFLPHSRQQFSSRYDGWCRSAD